VASNLSRRIATLARRYNVDQPGRGALLNASLAQALASARMVLWAEREAQTALKRMATNPFRPDTLSDPEKHRKAVFSSVADAAIRVRACEAEVADLERRCAAAGITENDLKELAR